MDGLIPVDGSRAPARTLETVFALRLETVFELFPDANMHILHVVEIKERKSSEGKSGLETARERGEEIFDRVATIARTID